jgi:hypothetical protein
VIRRIAFTIITTDPRCGEQEELRGPAIINNAPELTSPEIDEKKDGKRQHARLIKPETIIS